MQHESLLIKQLRATLAEISLWLSNANDNDNLPRQWQTKLQRNLEAIFSDRAKKDPMNKRRRRYLRALLPRSSPILLVAVCCFLDKRFFEQRAKGQYNQTDEIAIILQNNPTRHITINREVLDQLDLVDQNAEFIKWRTGLETNNHHGTVSEQNLPSITMQESLPNPTSIEFSVIEDHALTSNLSSQSSRHDIETALATIAPDLNITSIPLLANLDQKVWEPYGEIPCVYEASRCWEDQSSPPSSISILKTLVNHINLKDHNMEFFMDHHPCHPAETLNVLNTNDNRHAYVTNIPTKNQPQLSFPLPHRKPSPEWRHSNWGYRGTQFPFHTDGPQEGLVTTIAPCIKLWFLLPPTRNNIQTAIAKNPNPNDYDHCVMVVTNSKEVIHIPAGCIHATITLRTGYLTGINFVDAYSIKGAIHGICHSLLDPSGLAKTDLPQLYKAFEMALTTIDHHIKHGAMKIWNENSNQLIKAIEAPISPEWHKFLAGKGPFKRLIKLIKEVGLEWPGTQNTNKKRKRAESATQMV